MSALDGHLAASACENVYKGYPIATGYMGWIPWYNTYMLFATEQEYYDYVDDNFMKEELLRNESVNWKYDENCGLFSNEGQSE